MRVKHKIIIALSSILAVLALIFMIKWQHDIAAKQASIENQMVAFKQLADNVARAQTNVVSKDDLEKFGTTLGLNMSNIQKDISSLNATIAGISNTQVQTSGFRGSGLGSTTSKVDPTAPKVASNAIDQFGYLTNRQGYDLNEPFGTGTNVPFGTVGFSAWEAKPWDITIFPRDYSIDSVISEDQAGKKFIYNKITITAQNKTYEIPIQKSTFKEVLPSPSFSINPKLYLGLGAIGIINPIPSPDVVPTLGVSVFSYGKTKADPDAIFLGLGLGIEARAIRPSLTVLPAAYNIGHHIPLMHNLFLAPFLGVDTKGAFSVGGGLVVGL